MKSGLTITELAQEIERQNAAKADYLVKTSDVEMESLGGPPMLRVLDANGVDKMEPLEIQETARAKPTTPSPSATGTPWIRCGYLSAS